MKIGLGFGLDYLPRHLGGASNPAPTMPSGALGIWYASDYETVPRKRIKNSIVNGAADQNLLSAPRRLFTSTTFGTSIAGAGNTIVDGNATAPDGTNDASTVTAGGTNGWSLRTNPNTITLPAGTYTVCVSAKSISGSTAFQLGENGTGLAAQVATPSWGRYTKTFTTAGSAFLLVAGPVAPAAQTLLFCDFELFPGSADLNPNPLGAAPLSVQNLDLKLGKTAVDASSAVTGGALINASTALIQFPSAITPSSYTVVYLAKRSAAGNNAGFQAVIANAGAAYTTFSAGNNNNQIGTLLNGTHLDRAYNVLATQTKFDLWAQLGSGPFVGAHRYDGAKANSFVNGVKLLEYASVVAAPANIKDLFVGLHTAGFYSGLDFYALAYYPRALSDAEIVQAYNALNAKVAVTAPRTAVFVGTSIVAGSAGVPYPYFTRAAPVPYTHGSNAGVVGFRLSDLVAGAAAIDAMIAIALPQRFILSVDVGGNDLGNPAIWGTNPTGFAAALASYCDARRAAGWKVVVHTIPARNDFADGGVTFNSNRAVANGIIRNFVTNGYADAISDPAANSILGADGVAGVFVTGAVAGTANALRLSVPTPAGYFSAGSTIVGLSGTFSGLTVTGYTPIVAGAPMVTNFTVTAVGSGWIEIGSITVTGGTWTSGGFVGGNNYWAKDAVHPLDAAYAIWEPLTTAAINGL